jgi:ribosome biogenesis GTPase
LAICDIILTNTINSQGIDELRFILKREKLIVPWFFGVGKSSLINKLIEEDIIKTGEISDIQAGENTQLQIEKCIF